MPRGEGQPFHAQPIPPAPGLNNKLRSEAKAITESGTRVEFARPNHAPWIVQQMRVRVNGQATQAFPADADVCDPTDTLHSKGFSVSKHSRV
jgi:hypothetical protein